MRLTIEDLRYTYHGGDHPVLNGVSLDVQSGTSAAIIGPSGSGKTTLLSLLGGLLPLQHGRIDVVDDDGNCVSVQHAATWVLQTVSLLPDRTASDNVKVGAYSDGAHDDEAEKRARACLDAVGLSSHTSALARHLSGGEAQRVAIARALASHRPVILADEPTGQLDARTSTVVLDAMIGSHGDRTLVVVTHDPEVAARCSVVHELRDGILVERPGT